MSKWTKLLIGGAITSLLAWGAHATSGQNFIDSLGNGAGDAISASGVEGVTAAMDDSGSLNRVVVLSGDVDEAARAQAEEAALAVPGVSAVRWAGEDAAADTGAGDGEDAATQAAVTECQTGVDEAIAGKSINFRSGSAYMPDSSLTIVDEVAEALKACDGLSVAIGGHTDATGSAEVNQNLSQGRADAVAAALTERGVAADRITATGFGSSKPKVEGTGTEANDANRRIEFTVSGSAKADAADEGE